MSEQDLRTWSTQLETTGAERELAVWSGEVLEWVVKERLLMKQGRSWKGVLFFRRHGEEERE